jgi:hypothetical protein
MQPKSIDGIKIKRVERKKPVYITPLLTPVAPVSLPRLLTRRVVLKRNHVAITVAVFMLVSFAGGAVTVLESRSTRADDHVLGVTTVSELGPHPTELDLQNFAKEKISSFIQSWEQDIATQRHIKRREKLRAYLASKGSPFAKEDDTLDAFLLSPYTKLMLGITYAESGFVNCMHHNCSGIGGSSNFQSYPNHAEWVNALSRLLERRYKNWTIEKMNGVYVQPPNPNWVKAIYQTYRELEKAGVE